MPDPQSERTTQTSERAVEATQARPQQQPATLARGLGDHGGVYSHFHELAAADGGQEPPPEKLAPIFRREEYSHPVNDAQRARVLSGLQERYGNRYVQRVLSTNKPDPQAPKADGAGAAGTFYRQASPGNGSGAAPVEPIGGGGQPLDSGTRRFMESRFGHDFGGVQAHTGPAAQEAARDLNAEAFTTGRDIYFGQGNYDPSSQGGRGLLAHELAHVVQQDRGAAAATPQGFRVSQPGDPLEREAEAASHALLRGELLPPLGGAGHGTAYRLPADGGGRTPAAAPAPAAGGDGTRPAAPAPAAGGGGARPAAQSARAGDFPITLAGSTVVLPLGDLIDRAAPGGKVAVPDRILKKVPSIPAFKLTGASLDLGEDKLPSGATLDVATKIPPVEGTGSLSVDKQGSATGSVHVVFSPQKMPGLKQTEVDVKVKKDSFDVDAGLDFDLPKVTGRLDYKYRDGKHSGKGKAQYQGAKLSGSLEIIMSEAGLISGGGTLDMELFKGLRGQAQVDVDEKRNIKVKGKLSVPGQVELFPEKKYEKSFFSFEKKFPLWGFVIPVIDVNVGLFAEIHAGAGFRSKFGPGVLRNIELTGEFGTDPETATEFGLGGEFFLPAGAELVANVGGGIGLGLAVADITGGIEAVGVAGLYAALTVRPQFKYAGGKYTISGMAELAGVAQLKFGINAFAKVDVGLWIFKGTVWRKDWTLAEWVWNTGLNVALRANISYTLGEDFAPEISFETGQVDPEKFVKDVMPESGQPVPAPPKPPVAEKSTLTAEGAQGGPAGAAPPPGPTPATPGAPPTKTQAGSQSGAAVGPTGPQAPGAESPEHAKQVQAGLAAIDAEEKAYLTQGRIAKAEAEEVAKKVKGNHSVFKSLLVIDGGDSWDYDYVASPGNRRKGKDKEEARDPALAAYDAKLNASGNVGGTFGKFDFAGYPTNATLHPANEEYGNQNSTVVAEPTGSYEILTDSGTEGNVHTDLWRATVTALADGRYAALEQIRQQSEAAGDDSATTKQKLIAAIDVDNEATWMRKSVATIVDHGANRFVEQKYRKFNLPYQDIYLIGWSEHHIHPVSWKGSASNVANLQYLRDREHRPFTSFFNSRAALLKRLLRPNR
jgi:hypothetical protein